MGNMFATGTAGTQRWPTFAFMSSAFCPCGDLRCAPMNGYPRSLVAPLAGLTRRQVEYLAEREVVTPSLRSSSGRGSPTIYADDDLRQLAVLGALAKLFAGEIPIDVARRLTERLDDVGSDWKGLHLAYDGDHAYLCRDLEETTDSVMRSAQIVLLDLEEISSELGHQLRRRAA